MILNKKISFSADLAGENGDFKITEAGSHQEAGSIRKYDDAECSFFYYYNIKIFDGKISAVFITDATKERLTAGSPLIPAAHIDVVTKNITQSFLDRDAGDIQEKANRDYVFPVNFEWKI